MASEDTKYQELLAKLSSARDELDRIVMNSKNKRLKQGYVNFFKALTDCYDYIDKKHSKYTS